MLKGRRGTKKIYTGTPRGRRPRLRCLDGDEDVMKMGIRKWTTKGGEQRRIGKHSVRGEGLSSAVPRRKKGRCPK